MKCESKSDLEFQNLTFYEKNGPFLKIYRRQAGLDPYFFLSCTMRNFGIMVKGWIDRKIKKLCREKSIESKFSQKRIIQKGD